MQEKLTVLLFAAEYLLTQDYENIYEFNTRICASPLSIERLHDVGDILISKTDKEKIIFVPGCALYIEP